MSEKQERKVIKVSDEEASSLNEIQRRVDDLEVDLAQARGSLKREIELVAASHGVRISGWNSMQFVDGHIITPHGI